MLWSTTCLLQSATIHPEPQLQGEGSREVFYCFWLFAFPLSYIPWLYKRLLKSLTHVIWTDPKSFHDRQDKLGKAFYGAVLRTKPIWSYGQHVFSCFLTNLKNSKCDLLKLDLSLTYFMNLFGQFLFSLSLALCTVTASQVSFNWIQKNTRMQKDIWHKE